MNDLKNPLRIDSSLCSITFHETNDECKVLITKFTKETELPITINNDYKITSTKYCTVLNGKIQFKEHYAVIALKLK